MTNSDHLNRFHDLSKILGTEFAISMNQYNVKLTAFNNVYSGKDIDECINKLLNDDTLRNQTEKTR